jgi:hypothetical protein
LLFVMLILDNPDSSTSRASMTSELSMDERRREVRWKSGCHETAQTGASALAESTRNSPSLAPIEGRMQKSAYSMEPILHSPTLKERTEHELSPSSPIRRITTIPIPDSGYCATSHEDILSLVMRQRGVRT